MISMEGGGRSRIEVLEASDDEEEGDVRKKGSLEGGFEDR
jgi:hypothetical protein